MHQVKFEHKTIHTAWMIAGSPSPVEGGSSTIRSLISDARKMINSKISSRGGTGLSTGRSSLPKDFTVNEN